MHNKGDGNNGVGNKHAEILADQGAAHELAAGYRGEDEKRVEKDYTQYGVFYRGAADRGPANEQGGNGVQADLRVRAVGLHNAEVLQHDNLRVGRQQR